jgi:spore maturation protein CgeB
LNKGGLVKNGLKIAFFGSSLLSAYWNGAATYYRGIIKELHALGHTITFFESDAYNRQANRDVDKLEYARSIVYPSDSDGVKNALRLASGSDVIVKASGVGVFDEFLEKSVLELQSENTIIIYWDVDAPATLDRIKNNKYDPFRSLIGCFDTIFTYGGGDPVVSAYKAFGAKCCIPVYNALDPDTHYPVASDSRFEGTLGFTGNRLPDREERVQEFFFTPARLLPNRLFYLGGCGWEHNVPLLPNVKRIGHVFTTDHNTLNSSTLAVLNINRQSMVSYGYSPPTRIFEAAGAAACIITDQWAGIEQFLEPDKECLVATSGTQVADYLKSLDPEKAKIIGHAARKRILAEHTYKHRAVTVEKALWDSWSRKEVAL